MARYSFYIDGFNMYYALKNNGYQQYKWLNYHSLAEKVIQNKDTISSIYYFTALTHWKKANMQRHKEYIKALRSVGIKDVQGKFKKKTIKCHVCGKQFKTHEEKRTDVNLALKIFSDAVDDVYDKAVIISADSDMIPAIEAVHSFYPTKEVGIMLPIGNRCDEIKLAADFRLKMKGSHLAASQFPDEIVIGSEIIKKPDSWR